MDLEAALTRALDDTRTPSGLRDLVRTLHEQPDDSWRACCKSNCRPCVTDLAKAVDRLREILSAHA